MTNMKPVKLGNNVRMSFAKINEVLDMPNLIEVQKNSYQWFLEEGLREVFEETAAITDYNGNLVLDFIGFRIEETPKYPVEECPHLNKATLSRNEIALLYYIHSILSSSASSIILTPRACALVSLLPAASPATTYPVLEDTDPLTLPPFAFISDAA